MNDLYDGLLQELECKICLTFMAPPIRQCETGHSICANCKDKLQRCPLCQGHFTESRNISLESLARKMHYPCINEKSGCKVKLTLDNRENHERECNFKEYKCHYSRCPWVGNYEDILSHWMQKKQASKPYGESQVCHTKMQPQAFYVNIVKAYNQLFWYKFKQYNGKLFWTVQFVGAAEQANDFYFEVEVFKPGQPIRKYIMSEYCQPEEIDVDILHRTPGACIQATMDAISHFANDDQLLIYYMRVKSVKNYLGVDEDSHSVVEDNASVCSEPNQGRKTYHRGRGQNNPKWNPNKRGGRGVDKKY